MGSGGDFGKGQDWSWLVPRRGEGLADPRRRGLRALSAASKICERPYPPSAPVAPTSTGSSLLRVSHDASSREGAAKGLG